MAMTVEEVMGLLGLFGLVVAFLPHARYRYAPLRPRSHHHPHNHLLPHPPLLLLVRIMSSQTFSLIFGIFIKQEVVLQLPVIVEPLNMEEHLPAQYLATQGLLWTIFS